MNASLDSTMCWLLPAPDDFNAMCKEVFAGESGQVGSRLRQLANHRLDENQLFRLDRTVSKARKAGQVPGDFQSLTLGVISNATTDLLGPSISASALRHGLLIQVVRGDYGQVMQEALSPESTVNSAAPAAVLLAIDYRWYPLRTCAGDAQQAEVVVDACVSQLQTLCRGIKDATGAVCIVQTLAAPAQSLFGNLDRALPGTLLYLIDRLNRRIARMVQESDDLLFDVSGMAQEVGLTQWHDPAAWNLAKLPFSNSCLPLYAERVARILGAMRGKSRRCLILDLDNTLWGGVIGDDGLEGIQLAQGDAAGEAFLEVQRLALELRNRGVVLAVCSKNTDAIARRPFAEHTEMILKLDHVAIFQANWDDKATNIRSIANALALGLDSMVFLDDNPTERGLIRRELPQVAVPELPSDPALYARTLAAAGYFESIRFLPEDMKRADFYKDNGRRAELLQQTGDLASYLASLKMEITFQPFDATGRRRIAQLINKSNQFNLTTRRYSESEVAAVELDPECFALQVRLSDIYGDNGMISVVICRRTSNQTMEFDTWLMSCRVLGRHVENAVLHEVISRAKEIGVTELVGRYIPTDRNALVKDHYKKLGFEKVTETDAGETVWRMDVLIAPVGDLPFVVHRPPPSEVLGEPELTLAGFASSQSDGSVN